MTKLWIWISCGLCLSSCDLVDVINADIDRQVYLTRHILSLDELSGFKSGKYGSSVEVEGYLNIVKANSLAHVHMYDGSTRAFSTDGSEENPSIPVIIRSGRIDEACQGEKVAIRGMVEADLSYRAGNLQITWPEFELVDKASAAGTFFGDCRIDDGSIDQEYATGLDE